MNRTLEVGTCYALLSAVFFAVLGSKAQASEDGWNAVLQVSQADYANYLNGLPCHEGDDGRFYLVEREDHEAAREYAYYKLSAFSMLDFTREWFWRAPDGIPGRDCNIVATRYCLLLLLLFVPGCLPQAEMVTGTDLDGTWSVLQDDGTRACIAIANGYVTELLDGCESPVEVLAADPIVTTDTQVLVALSWRLTPLGERDNARGLHAGQAIRWLSGGGCSVYVPRIGRCRERVRCDVDSAGGGAGRLRHPGLVSRSETRSLWPTSFGNAGLPTVCVGTGYDG